MSNKTTAQEKQILTIISDTLDIDVVKALEPLKPEDREIVLCEIAEMLATLKGKIDRQEPIWGDQLIELAFKLDYCQEVLED
jgi:hypothetical protein